CTMRFGVASIRVTATERPSSVKTRLIPALRPTIPTFMTDIPSIQLDLHVHAGSEVELHQRIHGLVVRIDDVHDALVGAHFVLVARVLVDVRRNQDRIALLLGRQRNRTAHLGAGTLRRLDDFAGRTVDQAVVERLQPDADLLLLCHNLGSCWKLETGMGPVSRLRAIPLTHLPAAAAGPSGGGALLHHSMIFDTTPAPTVRPPSRIAKRRPSSIAIGPISVTVIFTLSPGITISTPSGSSHEPVTSVVRK